MEVFLREDLNDSSRIVIVGVIKARCLSVRHCSSNFTSFSKGEQSLFICGK